VTELLDQGALEERVRAFAARLEGAEVQAVQQHYGCSIYVRWESRGVKRALEVQAATLEPAGVSVWATASKARKDRSLRMAVLPATPPAEALESALAEALAWADLWKVSDFF
jgi:hypothetical protein